MSWKNRIVGEAMVPPDQLLANPFNYRMHPKYQRNAMRGALAELGWLQRVIVNKTTEHMIDGHLRVELALEDGESVPVTYVELSEQEERLALSTFDPLTGLAEIDNDILQDLLKAVHAEDDDLDQFLDSMRDDPGTEEEPAGEDDIPEPKPDPVTAAGDVWILGDHRLICGDTTKSAVLDLLMGEELADMVWTDPPYNVDYDGGAKPGNNIDYDIKHDNVSDKKFQALLNSSIGNLSRVTKRGGVFYVAYSHSSEDGFRTAMAASGLLIKQCLIWAKSKATLTWHDYNQQHEPILYGWKPGAAHYFAGDFTLTTLIDDLQDPEEMSKDDLVNLVNEIRAIASTSVLRFDKPHQNKLHPTMKPVALVRRCINASSRHGEIVLDGFGGSGTTLIACEAIGRKARLVEFDPVFCDVIIQRWQEYSGKQAQRESDGVMFNNLVDEVDTAA